MTIVNVETNAQDTLSPHEGWGEIPASERPLWTRYLTTHLPWFPGRTGMALTVQHLAATDGLGAPALWKRHARDLHAAGFNPLQFYVLAQVVREALERGRLDPARHGHLFEHWPESSRGPLVFRLAAHEWEPWLRHVRDGESPHRALRAVLD
ncbi:hypothetical protein GCM10027591_09800 [Zhihengliuella somnathii]